MIRTLVLICGCAAALFLTGCATDPVDETISKIQKATSDAATQMNEVSRELEKLTTKAKKNNSKITAEQLKEVYKKTKKIRDAGSELAKLNVDAEEYKNKLAPERQKELFGRFGADLRAALKRLNTAQEKLIERQTLALRQMDETNSDALKENIRLALQEFASLTRQQ